MIRRTRRPAPAPRHSGRAPRTGRPLAAGGRRVVALAAGLALGTGVLAGCGVQGSSEECGPDACLVTFDRSVEAKASALGVDATLVGSDADSATVEVAGEQVSLSVEQDPARVADLYVSLVAVNGEQAFVRIGRTPSS